MKYKIVCFTIGLLVFFSHHALSATFENGRIEVYLSTHQDLQNQNYVLEKEIVRFIDEAKTTLDIAVQELRSGKIHSENPIKEAIKAAAARGVKVNLIVEKGYLDAGSDNLKTFDAFKETANIQVKADDNPAIFHDKFIVRDFDQPTAALLTGSTNFTDTGTRRNYNHIFIVHFPSQTPKNYNMLRAYRAEFDELWSGTFGNKLDGEMGIYGIGSTYIKVLFSPDNDPDDYLLETVIKANNTLDVMMFTFGSNSPLMSGVINRFQAVKYVDRRATDKPKVKVRVGLEKDQCRFWSVYPVFKKLEIPMKVEKTGAKLHHKTCIIDNKTVVLGSYNWTLAANNKNDENTVIVTNPEIAQLFTQAFDELWEGVLK